MKKVNLLGRKLGDLLVIAAAPSRKFYRDGKLVSTRAHWLCRCTCGKEQEFSATMLLKPDRHCCGCIRNNSRGEKHFNWKGGRQKTDKGYIRLTRPVFPGSESVSSETTFEHQVVMARHLGRPLRKDETVHHRNGIRDDNRIENLELKASSHGPGQAIPDLVAWAKEILSRYGPSIPSKIVSPCCV